MTMWMRSWSARATLPGAEAYRRHFESDVLPRLRDLPGQRGALLLQRGDGAEAEVMVLTLWDSMAAIHAFAGAEPTTAVVAPEAQAVLKDYDRAVRIFEVLLDARPEGDGSAGP
jgi:heme-degrading monooxygenase HmoA